MMYKVSNYDICIVRESRKNYLLGVLQKDGLINKKIITMEEVVRKYYYDYDKRAVFFLMKKYDYQYDVAKMYLSHLIEVEDCTLKGKKIDRIREIKSELENQKLLIRNPYFREYLKNKNIIVFDCDYLTKFELKMLKEIEGISHIDYYQEEREKYVHEEIVECDTKEQEVSYVAREICELVKENKSIQQIKVYARDEYYASIQRIFKWFHIPVSLDSTSLYQTEIGQLFLRNMTNSKVESIQYIEDNFSLKNPRNLEIYNQIISILNNYTWCDDLIEIKAFLEDDFRCTEINSIKDKNTVVVVHSLDDIMLDDYLFIMGFNQGEIPNTYKDEDYFSDKEKRLIGLEATDELNEISYHKWAKMINEMKDVIITMKKSNDGGECFLSSLNDELKLDLVRKDDVYTNSNLYNQLKLASKLDTLLRYNEIEIDLDVLYTHYPEIRYHSFHNQYQEISKDELREYLNYQFHLSYSSMNTYYQCAFRYYLSNILKLNIYEETFYTILGNLFHHVLSLAFTKDINLREEYYRYLEGINYSFNAREKYFIDSLEEELEFVIRTIKRQNEGNTLTNIYTEEKIEIPKKYEDVNVIFKGFVDKMMLNDSFNEIAIVDYKTGNPDLNLNHIIYGLDMQLPVYVYLALYRFKDARVVGFYLQKILNTEIAKDYQHEYVALKEDKLRLQGYSNSDLSILGDFEPHYYDSKVIKGMRVTSKGVSSKKVLDDEKIEKLVSITNQKIDEAIEGISNADFTINPKRIGMDNIGCKYCTFHDICFMSEGDIVNLREYKNMEFLGGDEDDT